jgi:hypothetical protein
MEVFTIFNLNILFMKTTELSKTRMDKTDLSETKDDKKHLLPDEAILDLPEVKDIPGQEHIRPVITGEIADSTISSADEEGTEILDTDEDIVIQDNSNVTKEEKELLKQSSESSSIPDDLQLKQAVLDNEDEDGTPLNESINLSGNDLDVPGSEDDDENEEIGEEDEENNYYSLNDEKEDDINTRQ